MLKSDVTDDKLNFLAHQCPKVVFLIKYETTRKKNLGNHRLIFSPSLKGEKIKLMNLPCRQHKNRSLSQVGKPGQANYNIKLMKRTVKNQTIHRNSNFYHNKHCDGDN